MSESKEVAVIEEITPDQYPKIYGHGSLGQYVDRVKEVVSKEVPDLTTAKGRARVASLAAKVSRSKAAVEKPGREYLKKIKQLPKTIEVELREFVQQMDALRDETRKPLIEWEQAEAHRKAKHRGLIDDMYALAAHEDRAGNRIDAATLNASMEQLQAIRLGEHWEEFEAEAARAKQEATDRLQAAIQRQERYEAEQAELERLRKLQAEQEQRDREEKIRQEAIEAERKAAAARAEAEEKARREAEEKAERERQSELEKARREKEQAEERAKRAAAEERARIEAEQAEAEAEKARIEAEQERVAADKRHRAKINNEALEDMVGLGLDQAAAKALVMAIVRGEVRHVSVNYRGG